MILELYWNVLNLYWIYGYIFICFWFMLGLMLDYFWIMWDDMGTILALFWICIGIFNLCWFHKGL